MIIYVYRLSSLPWNSNNGIPSYSASNSLWIALGESSTSLDTLCHGKHRKSDMENDHRNSGFTHWTWWFSIVFGMFTRGYILWGVVQSCSLPSLIIGSNLYQLISSFYQVQLGSTPFFRWLRTNCHIPCSQRLMLLAPAITPGVITLFDFYPFAKRFAQQFET